MSIVLRKHSKGHLDAFFRYHAQACTRNPEMDFNKITFSFHSHLRNSIDSGSRVEGLLI